MHFLLFLAMVFRLSFCNKQAVKCRPQFILKFTEENNNLLLFYKMLMLRNQAGTPIQTTDLSFLPGQAEE